MTAGTGADVIGLVGLGVLVVALARSARRRIFVVVSGGTLLVLLAVATVLGHAD